LCACETNPGSTYELKLKSKSLKSLNKRSTFFVFAYEMFFVHQDSTLKAVLANFSNATKPSANKDGDYYNNDVVQFGQLLKVLLDYCDEYTEVQ
jgi:hypothetical protein